MGILGRSGLVINWEYESFPEAKDVVALPFFAAFFAAVRLFLDRFLFEGLYMYAAGFYTYSILALLFWETRRSDFVVSMTHHIATVILLALSYIFRFTRVAPVVLALHDATDVFLEVAKMSKYGGFERTSSIFFTTFVFCWTVLRIICYPLWILRSTSYEVVLTLDMEKHAVDGPIYYYIFNTLLFCLLIVNIYWWSLMVGMVVEQIHARGHVSDDVRSGCMHVPFFSSRKVELLKELDRLCENWFCFPSQAHLVTLSRAVLDVFVCCTGLILETSFVINWEYESYPEARDFLALPFFAIFFPTVRLVLDKCVFENLARRLIIGKGHARINFGTQIKRQKINKFKESAWKCVYFFSAELLALVVSYDEPWFTNTKYFWEGPGNQAWPYQKTKLKLKGLYMYVGGFYAYSILALLVWETRRSDFGVSMAHHVATVILIVLSYILRFTRVGSVVLAVHDVSDIFLEVAKMSKYSGIEWIASISFIVFVCSWTVLRIIYYPFWVIWSTSYEVLLNFNKENHQMDGPICYYLFNTLLIWLLVLHIYWWKLMVGMVVKQIQARGQVSDDVRSDGPQQRHAHLYFKVLISTCKLIQITYLEIANHEITLYLKGCVHWRLFYETD
ncbi:hypothetical protein CUMW_196010 [Citrus unshiu]|nr:hypothetical protein CUMW_196010 [Citrus unshiu]